MAGIPGLYFVIAGDDLARCVRPDPDNGLHTVQVVDFRCSRPGDGPTDPSETHEARDARHARRLAELIDQEFAVDLFSHLVLIAPPRLLDTLTLALDASTRASLHGSLAKDLMAVPDLELWPYLLPWLQPEQLFEGSALFMKDPRFPQMW